MLIFYYFTSYVHFFPLEIYNKTIIRFGFCFDFGSADNSYLDTDNSVYQKNLIQLAFLTPCDQAFNPPFLGGKIIELAKFCFKNKRFEPSLLFFSKQVIVSHCV